MAVATAGEHGPRGGLGVEHVVLAVVAPLAPVALVDFDDAKPLSAHKPGEAGPVGTGAFDPEGFEVAEGASPSHQGSVAGAVRWYAKHRETSAQAIDRDRDMLVLVGVDPDDHLDGGVVSDDAVGHVAGLLHRLATPSGRGADRTVTGLSMPGPYSVTASRPDNIQRCCPTGPTDRRK